jgi:hypothetical protein
MLKALVIRDDKKRFKDLGDVIAVARAEGQKLFKTRERVNVVECFYSFHEYYVVVVEFSFGRSAPLAQAAETRS